MSILNIWKLLSRSYVGSDYGKCCIFVHSLQDKESKGMMFNERIKQLHEACQMPQRKLAAATGIDTASCCKMEKGERRVRKEHVIVIADLLQTDYEELLKLWLVDQVTAVMADDKELSNEVLKIAKEI